MIEALKDWVAGKPYAKRSSKWPAVRREHLRKHPKCEVCGTTKRLQVHHIHPIHLERVGELEPSNLLTVCATHHLLFGHFLNWHSFNLYVVEDAETWNHKITNRPK